MRVLLLSASESRGACPFAILLDDPANPRHIFFETKTTLQFIKSRFLPRVFHHQDISHHIVCVHVDDCHYPANHRVRKGGNAWNRNEKSLCARHQLFNKNIHDLILAQGRPMDTIRKVYHGPYRTEHASYLKGPLTTQNQANARPEEE